MNPLDHELISRRYFFPHDGPLEQPFWIQSGDYRLACYREHRHHDALTFVHFHGNGELVRDYMSDYKNDILNMGLNVVFVEYRGYGSSTGTPQLAAMLDDTEAVFEAIGLPASQLLIYGRSIGSIYAIEFAHRFPDIAGLVLESGIAEPLERILLRVGPEELGVTTQELQDAADSSLHHKKKLEGYSNPLLVMHTRHDGLVELSHAERNHAWANSKQKALHVFEHGNHNSIMHANWEDYLVVLKNFARSL